MKRRNFFEVIFGALAVTRLRSKPPSYGKCFKCGSDRVILRNWSTSDTLAAYNYEWIIYCPKGCDTSPELFARLSDCVSRRTLST